MRHVFGTFPESTYRVGEPLPRQSRIAFEHWETHAGGYFDLIGPFFKDMALHQCDTELHSINVLFVLSGPELLEATARTNKMLKQFAALEHAWRHHQGRQKVPGQPERQVYVTLYRRRLVSIVNWLQRMFTSAYNAGHCVVFGNGVCYRMLCGIKLPPGTKVYS
jgi:hypothetical protein